MLLGDLIARFDDEALALETLLSLDDLALAANVRSVCKQRDCSLGEFASAAIRIYCTAASDEEWVTMLGAMGRTQTPGRELLRRALLRSLESEPVAHG